MTTKISSLKVAGGALALAILCAIAAAMLSGCSGFERALYDTKVETVPGVINRTNVTYVTNTVAAVETRTNGVTGEVSSVPVIRQVTTPEFTYEYAPPTYRTNLVPRAGVETIMQTAGSMIPLPFAGTAAAVLAWLYTLYANIKNKRVAAGIVQSVQRGREFLQDTPEGQKIDEQFKKILAEHQDSAGIVDEVQKLLTKYVDKKG